MIEVKKIASSIYSKRTYSSYAAKRDGSCSRVSSSTRLQPFLGQPPEDHAAPYFSLPGRKGRRRCC